MGVTGSKVLWISGLLDNPVRIVGENSASGTNILPLLSKAAGRILNTAGLFENTELSMGKSLKVEKTPKKTL